MIILNVISAPKAGGAELLVRELSKIYSSREIEAYAIYLSGSAQGLERNELVLGSNPRSHLNIFRIRKILKMLHKKENKQLIVHAHLTWPFFYVVLASIGLSKIELIYTEHNTTNKRRKIPFFWILERLFYARYARVICISQGVYDALASWVGPKLTQRLITIPNGSRIYSLADRSAFIGRLPRLVSVGSLSPKKNFVTAIKAIAQLKDEVHSYTIVGEGPERARLEAIIREEKLEDKVYMPGWSDAIEQYFHAADIQLIPSLWEGFGLVAVEGMSTGLPVVASNVDGLREVLDESNPSVTLIDKVGSVEAWVAGIRKATSDLCDQGARRLAQSSRKQAEKFTLNEMAERYLGVYREQ